MSEALNEPTKVDPAKLQASDSIDASLSNVNEDVLEVEIDPRLEKKVWRKLDLFILPLVSMFWLLSFLDRTNLGNARVAGLQKALKLSNDQYSMALTVTYLSYMFAELPSNLMLRRVGANILLPTLLVLWGIVTALQGIVHNYSGLLACRFFLGLFEGGLFPGLVLYLSEFYPRDKLAWRLSVLFSSAALASAFSGLLAFGILNMDGMRGKPGWAWIFILEGVFTIAFGAVSYFLLPRTPATASFLSSEEKNYISRQLFSRGSAAGANAGDEAFSWREVGKAFTLPQVWFMAIMFFPAGVTLFGLAYFTPSILSSFGYSPTRTQLMSVPPFAVAFVVSLIVAWLSDRYRSRGVVALSMTLLCVIGFAMFLGSTNHHVQYGSLFFIIAGVNASGPPMAAWNSNNVTPHTRRATALAIGFIMTNAGGLLATWLLAGRISPGPRYTKATIILLVLSFVGILAIVGNITYLKSQNRKKAKKRAEGGTPEDEDAALGDQSAWFIYSL